MLPATPSPRLAVRALIVKDDRVLLVNAYPGKESDLWCLPGGGAEPGQSLPDNLAREVKEETGLGISVGAPVLVNEFHDPESGFHQVDLIFRATITTGQLDPGWTDPEGVVNRRGFFSRDDVQNMRLKPDALYRLPWEDLPFAYDPLERLVR